MRIWVQCSCGLAKKRAYVDRQGEALNGYARCYSAVLTLPKWPKPWNVLMMRQDLIDCHFDYVQTGHSVVCVLSCARCCVRFVVTGKDRQRGSQIPLMMLLICFCDDAKMLMIDPV